MLLRALVLVLTIAGCHHDPPPAAPAATEPKTPVGYLLDPASQLHLEPEQTTHLKELDANLAQQLAVLDPQIATAMKAQADASDSSSTSPSGGGMRGMRGGMGGMGGMGGGGMGRRGNNAGSGAGSGTPRSKDGKSDTLGRLLAQRASDVRATLVIVFSSLHPDQLAIAKRVLVDHDVDIEDDDADSGGTASGANANAPGQGDEHGPTNDGSGGDRGRGDPHPP
jgi:hypothetical protein